MLLLATLGDRDRVEWRTSAKDPRMVQKDVA
jgi:hypothetical protein